MSKETSHKILIIDDDKDILDLLKYNLKKEGYEVMVERKGSKSLDVARKFQPNLIILDIMMPEINGIDVCKMLREIPDFDKTYIFFLTAKSDKGLQSLALGTGGDDYIEKITGLRALMHKVGTVLKKDLVISKRIKKIHLGDLSLERDKNMITYKNRVIILPKDEFELLYFFAQNPRKVITQNNLLNNIWGSEVYIFSKSVDAYVTSICQKVGAHLITRTNKGQYKLTTS